MPEFSLYVLDMLTMSLQSAELSIELTPQDWIVNTPGAQMGRASPGMQWLPDGRVLVQRMEGGAAICEVLVGGEAIFH